MTSDSDAPHIKRIHLTDDRKGSKYVSIAEDTGYMAEVEVASKDRITEGTASSDVLSRGNTPSARVNPSASELGAKPGVYPVTQYAKKPESTIRYNSDISIHTIYEWDPDYTEYKGTRRDSDVAIGSEADDDNIPDFSARKPFNLLPFSNSSVHSPSSDMLWSIASEKKWTDNPFTRKFMSSRGNEYFCEIDEDYLTDRFNLTGLNADVENYQHAIDLINDVFDAVCSEEDERENIEKSARHLYGLIHARYITTTRGLQKMVYSSIYSCPSCPSQPLLTLTSSFFLRPFPQLEKYKKFDFGRCPRLYCSSHPLLPTALTDVPGLQSVKLYCAKCEDIYNPKSSRHATIDGAYFGTSFQSVMFQVYPGLMPAKSMERYEPRCFGFRVHAAAALGRWQSERREEMEERIQGRGGKVGWEDKAIGGGGGE